MAEPGKVERRKSRMKVRDAQAAMLAMLPEIEALAARFLALNTELEPREPTDEFVFGRPSRESLRYSVAGSAYWASETLLEVLRHARNSAEETHADLLAGWEQEQERELESSRESMKFESTIARL